jgi:outer membrane lipoprotein-sorting protein
MKNIGIGVSLAALLAVPAIAQTPEQLGREVAAEASRRASGYGDMSAKLRMVNRNNRGNERVRELDVLTMEVPAEGTRTLIRFTSPADLRGTALLTADNADGSSDQWLYLPALHRVKRIGGAARSGSFMGSEFAFEDISAVELDRYMYRLADTDSLRGLPCWVVERKPTETSSQYARQLVWFDQAAYRVLRIEFYDRTGVLLKTLDLRGYRLHADHFWRPDQMKMSNHRTGGSTLLEWSDTEFGVGLEPRDFTPSRIGRRA